MSDAPSVPVLALLGDAAVEISWPGMDSQLAWERCRTLSQRIRAGILPGFVVDVAGFESLTVHYNSLETDWDQICHALQDLAISSEVTEFHSVREIEVPVCCDREFGIDLAEVARLCGISESRAIELFLEATYQVRLIGFAPGFPYLSGLPEQLFVPRLASPRDAVPAGSVAIAHRQAGIYPHVSPGGWRILGRTPLKLFDPERNPPAILQPGDSVRFLRISRHDFDRLLPGEP